jgi:hypothetical protein
MRAGDHNRVLTQTLRGTGLKFRRIKRVSDDLLCFSFYNVLARKHVRIRAAAGDKKNVSDTFPGSYSIQRVHDSRVGLFGRHLASSIGKRGWARVGSNCDHMAGSHSQAADTLDKWYIPRGWLVVNQFYGGPTPKWLEAAAWYTLRRNCSLKEKAG